MKTLSYPESPMNTPYETLKSMLLRQTVPKNFAAKERATFNTMIRSSNTSSSEFVPQLQKQTAKCDFGDQLHNQFRDRLIAGVDEPKIQRLLLEKSEPTFTDTGKMCED